MRKYAIPLERLKKAGIKIEVEKGFFLRLKDGNQVIAKITKVGKKIVIVRVK